MNVGPLTEEIFANAKSRPYSDASGTFVVQMGFPIGLRYFEGKRSITVLFEPLLKDRAWSRRVPSFLRSFTKQLSLDVSMESPAVWDNTNERPITPDFVIQDRIENALRNFGAPYTLRRTTSSTQFASNEQHDPSPL